LGLGTWKHWGKGAGSFATMAGFSFVTRKAFGESAGGALKGSLLETAAYFAFGPVGEFVQTAGFIASIGGMALGAYQSRRMMIQDQYRPNLGGRYMDTEQAYTMRQAAVQAINRTQMNARYALGNEASFLHR
jgi:hypothetical protein